MHVFMLLHSRYCMGGVRSDGLVEDTHAAVYKQLGDWVRACYGTPGVCRYV